MKSGLNKEQEAELARMNKWAALQNFKEMKCDVLGAAVGDKLVDAFGDDTSPLARTIAVIIDHALKTQPDHECQDLLLRWVREHYWGLVVGRHLEMFDRIYTGLVEGEFTCADPLVYGDIDMGAWFEPCETRKVFALRVYCMAADDDTYLYMRETNIVQDELHCRRCYPKANSRVWPSRVSMTTHRKKKFHLGYGDCRDCGYQFSFKQMLNPFQKDDGEPHRAGSVDSADDVKTYYALWYMRGIAEALDDYEAGKGYPRKKKTL